MCRRQDKADNKAKWGKLRNELSFEGSMGAYAGIGKARTKVN